MRPNASTTRRQFFGSLAAAGCAVAGGLAMSSGGRLLASGAAGSIIGPGSALDGADRARFANSIGLPVDVRDGGLVCLNNFGGRSNANGPCNHAGVDIGELVDETPGRPLLACVDGIIEREGSGSGPGNFRVLRGDDGRWYRYHHMNAFDPAAGEGDRVARGDVIGTMGKSGNTSWTHLHFEIWVDSPIPRDGTALDPVPLLLLPDSVRLDASRACH